MKWYTRYGVNFILASTLVAVCVFTAKAFVPAESRSVIMVSQENCPPCAYMKPIFRTLDEAGYDATIVDFKDYEGDVEIAVTPTLIFFRRDGQMLAVWEGMMTYQQIVQILEAK